LPNDKEDGMENVIWILALAAVAFLAVRSGRGG
jgi:hypothetical protein